MDDTLHLLQQILTELRRLNGQQVHAREVLSIPQAAEYLGQSEHTIREWVRLRKVPYFKLSGTIKFRRSKLDRWIDKTEVPILE